MTADDGDGADEAKGNEQQDDPDLENQANEETYLLLGKTKAAHLEDRLTTRIKIFRTAYTMNQACFVFLAVVSLALTSTVAVIQVVPNNHRIIVAALGAGATVITGIITYAKLEVEMKEQEDALLQTQSMLEKLRQLKDRDAKYLAKDDDDDKKVKEIGKICQEFVDVRRKTSTSTWLVSLGRASERDPDADENKDKFVCNGGCCFAKWTKDAWTTVSCCFCFTFKNYDHQNSTAHDLANGADD